MIMQLFFPKSAIVTTKISLKLKGVDLTSAVVTTLVESMLYPDVFQIVCRVAGTLAILT